MDVGHFIVTRFVAVELQPRSTKFNIVKYQSIWPFPSKPCCPSIQCQQSWKLRNHHSHRIAIFLSYITVLGQGSTGLVDS